MYKGDLGGKKGGVVFISLGGESDTRGQEDSPQSFRGSFGGGNEFNGGEKKRDSFLGTTF